MPNEITAIISVATLIALPTTSYFFNQWINRRHESGEGGTVDGETANWVAIGTGYTIVGFVILVALWAHRLPRDWTLGPAAGLILLVCFVVSGLPMWIGDRNRSHAIRVSRVARQKLGGN